MELEQLIVPTIAIYGAILSTIIFYQKLKENKPHIKIDHYFGRNPSAKIYVTLVVKNFGKRSITLSYAYLEEVTVVSIKQKIFDRLIRVKKETKRSERNYQVENREVESGKECKIEFSYSYNIPPNWINNVKKCRGVVVDQLGNKYQSKIIEL
jgi:hypothetical protein